MFHNRLPQIGLTVFHVKVLAALLMVIDHTGYVMEEECLRIVGRFSFPLFAWLLVQGSRHTQNWQRYERRLLMLATFSQPIYAVFIKSLLPLNPVFQLWLGLVLFRLIRSHQNFSVLKNRGNPHHQDLSYTASNPKTGLPLFFKGYIGYQITALLGVAIIGIVTIFFDYHYYGIGLIYLISSYPFGLPKSLGSVAPRVNAVLWVTAFIVLHCLYALSYPLQIFALPFIGLMPFLNTIDERGSKARWFYWFYPVHFVPLILIRVF